MSIYVGAGGVRREVAGGGGLKPKLVASGTTSVLNKSRFDYSFKLNTVYLLVVDDICYPPFVFETSSDELNLVNIVKYESTYITLEEPKVKCTINGISFVESNSYRSYKLYEL